MRRFTLPLIIILLLTLIICIQCFSHSAFATDYIYYVDNTNTTTPRDGTTWQKAWNGQDELDAGTQSGPWIQGQDTVSVYIKATDVPYIDSKSDNWWKWHSYIWDGDDGYGTRSKLYFDATGSGTTRGSKQARTWGVTAETMSLVAGTRYRATESDSDSQGVLNGYAAGNDKAMWLCTASSLNMQPLTKVATLAEVTAGSFKWFWDAANNYIYVDAGVAIDNSALIVYASTATCIEFWPWQEIYGGIFEYGLHGEKNGGCSDWIIDGSTLRNNAGCGTWTGGTGTYRRCQIYDNYSHGLTSDTFWIWSTSSRVESCIISHNGGDGVYWPESASPTIYNSTIVANARYGINFCTTRLNQTMPGTQGITNAAPAGMWIISGTYDATHDPATITARGFSYFTFIPSSSFYLRRIDIDLFKHHGSPTGLLCVSLYSDSAGKPGSLLWSSENYSIANLPTSQATQGTNVSAASETNAYVTFWGAGTAGYNVVAGTKYHVAFLISNAYGTPGVMALGDATNYGTDYTYGYGTSPSSWTKVGDSKGIYARFYADGSPGNYVLTAKNNIVARNTTGQVVCTDRTFMSVDADYNIVYGSSPYEGKWMAAEHDQICNPRLLSWRPYNWIPCSKGTNVGLTEDFCGRRVPFSGSRYPIGANNPLVRPVDDDD